MSKVGKIGHKALKNFQYASNVSVRFPMCRMFCMRVAGAGFGVLEFIRPTGPYLPGYLTADRLKKLGATPHIF
jgi:hypothetical protein